MRPRCTHTSAVNARTRLRAFDQGTAYQSASVPTATRFNPCARMMAIVGFIAFSRDTRIEINQVSVGITEKHRSIAPRLIRRFQDPCLDDFLESQPLMIDIVHFKLRARCTRKDSLTIYLPE